MMFLFSSADDSLQTLSVHMQVFLDAVESVNLLVNSNGTVCCAPMQLHNHAHGGRTSHTCH